MKKIFTYLLVCLLLVMSSTSQVLALETTQLDDAYNKIVEYYQTHKALESPDDIIAVEALGLEVEKGYEIPDLESQDFESLTLGDLSKTVIALTLIGKDPANIKNKNLIELLESYVLENGSIKDSYGSTTDIWVLLALESVSSDKVKIVADHLSNDLNDDGGFWYVYGGDKFSSVDTTGWGVEALSIAGKDTYQSSIQKAIDYIATQKAENGVYGFSANADTQSCVLEGLFAYDTNLVSQEEIDVLLSFQLADGSFQSEVYDENWNPTGEFTFNAYTTMEAARCLGTYKNGSVVLKAQKAYADLKISQQPVQNDKKEEEEKQEEKEMKEVKAPQTFDNSQVIVYSFLLLVSGSLVVKGRKSFE